MDVLGIASFFVMLSFNAIPIGGRTLSFSAKLIHRDSPESPFYDPTSTPFSRFCDAVHRSVARANFFSNVSASANSNSRIFANNVDPKSYSSIATNYQGVYTMSFGIGTGQEQQQTGVAIPDTGSELIWVLCKPCNTCYNYKGQLFDPEASSTYDKIQCRSNACSSLQHSPCLTNSSCRYNNTYLGRYSVSGILSTEKLVFDSSDGNDKVSVPGIIFGCTHETDGLTSLENSMGIVGLNAHKLSLTSQLNSDNTGSNKFSYCLPKHISKSSRIYFGPEAGVSGLRIMISGLKAMTTPLFIHIDNKYYLDLKKIVVAGHTKGMPLSFIAKQEIMGPLIRHGGNIMIDSGTTLTFIEDQMLNALLETLVRLIPNPKVDVPENMAHIIDLCWDWKEPMEKKKIPKLTMHFADGAELEVTKPFIVLKKINTLCLTVSSNRHTKGVTILGNFAHLGYRTVYDLDEEELTFLPENC